MADWRPMLNHRNGGIPRIMGVLNITPDSFHAASRVSSLESAINRACKMADDGADWIDIGAESTRPGASPVSPEEEERRVLPVVEAVRRVLPDICISIDTRRASVALAALDAGADMINDVSALSDPQMVDLVAQRGCPVCIMHMQGLPENMQEDPAYGDVVVEVRGSLEVAATNLFAAGVDPSVVIADPGIGFGKMLEHNLALLSAGRSVVPDERMPLLWGVSRKSMFNHLLGREETSDRLAGSLGIAAKAIDLGVDIIRVHDVAEHSDLFSAMSALEGTE
ncbi:MAG: dihydropteroate synthase [Candidatus Thalassarchaeum sp.]|nr:dihydropteroate synthase [Candidatus Thalassarchaeum sp.]HJM23829.1 dihydropteroate synthase [Candidatus Thalassarchaeum sp.]